MTNTKSFYSAILIMQLAPVVGRWSIRSRIAYGEREGVLTEADLKNLNTQHSRYNMVNFSARQAESLRI